MIIGNSIYYKGYLYGTCTGYTYDLNGKRMYIIEAVAGHEFLVYRKSLVVRKKKIELLL